MAFLIGVSTDATVSDLNEGKGFNLLTRTETNDGKVFVYVQANNAIDQYDGVTIDEAGQATKLAKAGVDDNHKVGVAQVAFANDDYGWVQVLGPTTLNIEGDTAGADKKLYTGTVAGVFSTTATTAQTAISGIVCTASAGTTDETAVGGLMATEPQSAAF